jgi:hypothetical protein
MCKKTKNNKVRRGEEGLDHSYSAGKKPSIPSARGTFPGNQYWRISSEKRRHAQHANRRTKPNGTKRNENIEPNGTKRNQTEPNGTKRNNIKPNQTKPNQTKPNLTSPNQHKAKHKTKRKELNSKIQE